MNGKSQKSINNHNAMYIHTYFTKRKWSKYTLFTLCIIHTKMQYIELYQYNCNRKIISVPIKRTILYHSDLQQWQKQDKTTV